MFLCNKEFATLFYYLGDTPAAANYGVKVSYSDLQDFERWVSYEFKRDLSIEEDIIEKVELCRIWLKNYDQQIQSRIGTRIINL
jgi:hypothetical protein